MIKSVYWLDQQNCRLNWLNQEIEPTKIKDVPNGVAPVWHIYGCFNTQIVLWLGWFGGAPFQDSRGFPPGIWNKGDHYCVLRVTRVNHGIPGHIIVYHASTWWNRQNEKHYGKKKKWCVATKSRVAPVKRPVHLSSSGPSIWRITSSTDCLIYYTTIYYYMIIWYYMQFWYFRFSEARNPAVKLTSSHQSALAWKSCPGGRLVAILMSCGCPTCTDSGGRH